MIRSFRSEDISTVVIDNGSRSVRVGYAGADMPLFDIHNVGSKTRVAANSLADDGQEKSIRIFGDMRLRARQTQRRLDVAPFIENGQISDWEMYTDLVSHIFDDLLRTPPTEHSILFSEQPLTPKINREKLCQIMFEKFEVPAIQIVKKPALSLFSQGKTSGLVVDVGHDCAVTSPVTDGFVVGRAVLQSAIAGRKMAELYQQVLGIDEKSLLPPAQQQYADGFSDSYLKFSAVTTMNDLLAATCQVFDGTEYDAQVLEQMPRVTYELPDGTILDIGEERYRVPEVLFDPEKFSLPKDIAGSNHSADLPSMITASTGLCDVDSRLPLFSNILVTGGCSQMPGLNDRLNTELVVKVPSVSKLKISSSTNLNERRYSTFMGASIIGSLSMFHSRWITKDDYTEMGNHIIHKKASQCS